jgi:hypothetical protein
MTSNSSVAANDLRVILIRGFLALSVMGATVAGTEFIGSQLPLLPTAMREEITALVTAHIQPPDRSLLSVDVATQWSSFYA